MTNIQSLFKISLKKKEKCCETPINIKHVYDKTY